MHNAESESKIVAGLWMLLKGQSGKITLWVSSFIIGKDILSIKSGSSLSGVMYTVQYTTESELSYFATEYLNESETKRKTFCTNSSGSQMGSNHEKTGVKKSCAYTPFNDYLYQ